MGMFTRFVHPKDGREIQVKTYLDDLEEYRVGDLVNWEIWPESPGIGKLLDGVHDGLSYIGEEKADCYVVLWHHRYVGVIERGEQVLAEQLEKIIPEYERSWWLESAWVKKEIHELELGIEFKQERLDFLKSLSGKSEEEIQEAYVKWMEKVMCAPIEKMLGWEDMARQLFKVQPLGGV